MYSIVVRKRTRADECAILMPKMKEVEFAWQKNSLKRSLKRLLDLAINSIYTHREIFLRELISNASDAIDKLYYKSLADGATGLNRDDFQIFLAADMDSRTLRIRDNGIGMTQEELDQNLGVIAKSGSLKFKSENEKERGYRHHRSFGVGFIPRLWSATTCAWNQGVRRRAGVLLGVRRRGRLYHPRVRKRPITAPRLFCISKEDTEEEKYSEFLDTYRIRSLVKKYSDYIRYPIRMEVEKTRAKGGYGERI